MATPARSPCENEDPCMWKGRFQSGSSKEDLADSFILKHAKHWQQLQVLAEVVRFYMIRGIKS